MVGALVSVIGLRNWLAVAVTSGRLLGLGPSSGPDWAWMERWEVVTGTFLGRGVTPVPDSTPVAGERAAEHSTGSPVTQTGDYPDACAASPGRVAANDEMEVCSA